jgi:hypothetical protein
MFLVVNIYYVRSKPQFNQRRVKVTGTAHHISVYLSVVMCLPEDGYMSGRNM